MIWTILKLEHIMVLNNVTMFHRIVIKTIHFREQVDIQAKLSPELNQTYLRILFYIFKPAIT